MLRIGIGLRCAACLLAALPLLDGCNLTAGIDTLLSAPRLTAEQEEIYKELMKSAAGTGISLKYPKSGEHLSAFTVADLDSDHENEAIVFYEIPGTAAEENPLRVCLLDQKDGKWSAVKDYTTAGAEIESVSITQLGENSRKNLIFCYSMVDGAEYSVEVLHYDNGALERTLSENYSVMDVKDLDFDGTDELLLISAATVSTSASATVYHLDAEGSYYRSQLALPDSFTEITKMLYGKIPSDNPEIANSGLAVYLDGMTGATTMQTEIITYARRMLQLQYADSPDKFPNTTRTAGCPSMDIDHDGETEIPIQTVFYGYAAADEADQIPMTSWYSCRGGQLMRKKASYYSASKGFAFLLPERWEKKVTAVPVEDEVVFYALDTDTVVEEGLPVLREPLLRITVVSDAETASNLENNGYLLMRQRGELRYLTKIEDSASPLAPTQSELLFAMRYF